MPSRNKIILTAALSLLLVAPLGGASSAHPHTHNYVGTAANNVLISYSNNGNEVSFDFQSALVGVCADGSPLLRQFFPPEPIRDGDADIGYGGGCFAYQTVYGDDTGATLSVNVQENVAPVFPVWVACVDATGDGLCTSAEPYVVCSTGPNGAYAIPAGPCEITAVPSPNPAIFVLVIGGLTSDPANPVVPHAGMTGTIFLG